MSDFQRALKKLDSKKKIQSLEKAEQSEGLRNALVAGKGNAVAGANRLGFKKEGLIAAEKLAKPAGKAAVKKGKR